MANYYESPRWSGEILDCSMPMTFDTYSECSFRCLYCFAAYQKALGDSSAYYRHSKARPVDAAKVKRIFTDPSGQFAAYVTARKAMQWGGMSDPFDENEREQGVSLDLLRFFRDREYPICFSTKGAWWTEDERYIECFRDAKHFNVKVSIITADADMARRVEVLVPTPQERLAALGRIAKWNAGGCTLRLRPYIIGLTEHTVDDLLRRAADAGVTAVSTEFFCLETRSSGKNNSYRGMSKALGFDVYDYYRKRSTGSGYLRLTRAIKQPHIEHLRERCDVLGLRFYVSDAHFKEECHNGSCCGLSENWNYSRGQFTHALLLAKEKGSVRWADIAPEMAHLAVVPFAGAVGFNTNSSERRAQFHNFSMRDYMRWMWNNVNDAKSPYKYFGGVLRPNGCDSDGNVVYQYVGA